MSKKAVTKPKEIETPVEDVEGSDPEAVEEKPEVVKPVNRPVHKESLTVTLKNGTSRTYSAYTHGKVWEALANNYAAANEGSKIE